MIIKATLKHNQISPDGLFGWFRVSGFGFRVKKRSLDLQATRNTKHETRNRSDQFVRIYMIVPTKAWMILVLFMVFGLAASESYAQADCNQRLSEATKQYQRGFFNRTIDLLATCRRTAFKNQNSETDAYRLVALSHIALDQEDKAYKWIKKIVSLDKKYIPDPNDLLRFRELVEEMRPGNRTLLVSGLGAAAAVTTVFLLTRGESGGNNESPLPGPISLPQ